MKGSGTESTQQINPAQMSVQGEEFVYKHVSISTSIGVKDLLTPTKQSTIYHVLLYVITLGQIFIGGG